MQNSAPAAFYQQQLEIIKESEKKLLPLKNQLSILRLAMFALSLISLWKLWPFGAAIALAGFALFFGLFIYLVKKDLNNEERIKRNKVLRDLIQEELKALNHHFNKRPGGLEFKPNDHDYANDLDIFGNASLYQYINRCSSEQGKKTLAGWLLAPAQRESILQRQQAAQELKENLLSIQEFRVHTTQNHFTLLSEEKIDQWLNNQNRFAQNPVWKITRFLYPLVSLCVLVLYIFSVIHSALFFSLLILFFIISFGITRFIMPHYIMLNKIVPELETFYQSIVWIEKLEIKSNLINELKKQFETGPLKASHSIMGLKKILERLDYRFNPLVFFPLNMFLLWDLQQMIALEKWRSQNKSISSWFYALGEMEALISVAILAFNHPDWCFPEISNEPGVFIAKDLGHPLIHDQKRVCNSFTVAGEGQLSLITGSNMAGKSTFLRSVGLAAVLSMLGAPVCARQLTLSRMKVMSSMRVNDNLEENTSTFYAELKKLKQIVAAIRKPEDLMVLLDEMLRGTNSADRHAGSMALVRQLVHHNTMALVATHDLELAKLADELRGRIHNYHFDVQVNQEELFFDYKLKTGICRSMNASLLMKKIGIELA